MIDTLPSLRVLPVVVGAGCWRLFGYYQGTRDVYRLVHTFYEAFDPNTPPTNVDIAVFRDCTTRLQQCTDLALIYGVHWSDMVDQFREARGRPRRAKRAA